MMVMVMFYVVVKCMIDMCGDFIQVISMWYLDFDFQRNIE